MALMALMPDGTVQMVYGDLEDGARMDTEKYNIFVVTTDIDWRKI